MRELKRRSIARFGPATVAPTSGLAAMMMAWAATGAAARHQAAASAGRTGAFNPPASEFEAEASPEIGQALIVLGQAGIGDVVHIDADALEIGEAPTELEAFAEQELRTEALLVGVRGPFRLAIVDGAA